MSEDNLPAHVTRWGPCRVAVVRSNSVILQHEVLEEWIEVTCSNPETMTIGRSGLYVFDHINIDGEWHKFADMPEIHNGKPN